MTISELGEVISGSATASLSLPFPAGFCPLWFWYTPEIINDELVSIYSTLVTMHLRPLVGTPSSSVFSESSELDSSLIDIELKLFLRYSRLFP